MTDSRRQLDRQLTRLQAVSERYRHSVDESQVSGLRAQRLSRMNRVYADLAAQTRYQQAVQFLIQDLFGTEELRHRSWELQKARSAMERILPEAMLETVAGALELTSLTLELDLAMAETLPDRAALDDADYRQAIRGAARRPEFERQIDLVVEIGNEIEHVVHRPFMSTALKMCRRPAKSMGLSGLQDFLERGFNAFKQMKGSAEFLETFRRRERRFLDEVFEEKDNHGGHGEHGENKNG